MKLVKAGHGDILRAIARDRGCYLLYLNPDWDSESEQSWVDFMSEHILWYADWFGSLGDRERSDAECQFLDGMILFAFDTKEELDEAFRQVRGTDGLPPEYKPGPIYACTVSPTLGVMNENT